MGTEGVYTHTVEYEKDPECIICSAGISLEIDEEITLQEVNSF